MITELFRNFRTAIFMNGSEVTKFCSNVECEQTEQVWRRFTLDFRAWHFLQPRARWNIYMSYETSRTQGYGFIFNGIVPDNSNARITVPMGKPLTFSVTGYDFIWNAHQRSPRLTQVFVPSVAGASVRDATKALENFEGKPGRYDIVPRIRTMHDAVRKLGRLAGVTIQLDMPNYPWAPYVFPPGDSFFSAIGRLVNPYAPHASYSRWRNQLILSDSPSYFMGSGTRMEIPAALMDVVDASALIRQRPSRIRLEIPKWRF